MDFNALHVFTRVAELSSFTQAAEQLGLTKSRVSTVVQQLEKQLGTRLLQRTTRHVRLSADGEQFLERSKELMADLEQLQAMFQPAASGLRGSLRIDMPNSLARDVVIPKLPEFLSAHPLLEVGISTSDRRVDVVQEGFDCVVRIGPLADTDLIARTIGAMEMCNLGPAYLERHGTPATLADLSRHRIIHYANQLGRHGAGWEYQRGKEICSMRSALVVNGTDAYQAACLAGLGLIQAPVRGARHLLDQGLLVEVMPDFKAAPMPVSLLYPHRRHIAPRVTAFLNWITEVLAPHLTGMDRS
jgi:DNA-binding transcriptional LysR family regulator